MRAGKLDREIEIQSVEYEDDGAGNQTETWTTVATMRAQLVQASTEEFMRDYGASSETLIVFRTRYLEGVTLAHRVVYDGILHNIKQVTEIGRRRGLELRTVSLGQPA